MNNFVVLLYIGLVQKSYSKYDGFVVLHGTDTLSYTACALSFMLENLGKPVVITGAQVSIYYSIDIQMFIRYLLLKFDQMVVRI